MRNHRDIERRQAEKNGRPMPFDRIENALRFGTALHQDGCRAGSKRKSQRITEAVREKDFGRRKKDVALENSEHAATVCEPRVERVVLQMNDAFGPARR